MRLAGASRRADWPITPVTVVHRHRAASRLGMNTEPYLNTEYEYSFFRVFILMRIAHSEYSYSRIQLAVSIFNSTRDPRLFDKSSRLSVSRGISGRLGVGPSA
eukprot:2620896-Prymnesium_polylepis.2